jgi:hypothetical protein
MMVQSLGKRLLLVTQGIKRMALLVEEKVLSKGTRVVTMKARQALGSRGSERKVQWRKRRKRWRRLLHRHWAIPRHGLPQISLKMERRGISKEWKQVRAHLRLCDLGERRNGFQFHIHLRTLPRCPEFENREGDFAEVEIMEFLEQRELEHPLPDPPQTSYLKQAQLLI